MSFLYSIILGALAGWIAGKIRRGEGYGFILNALLGIVGSVIGGFAFSLIGFSSSGLIGHIITSVVGAFILLFIADQFKK